jgi:hypothetical protein
MNEKSRKFSRAAAKIYAIFRPARKIVKLREKTRVSRREKNCRRGFVLNVSDVCEKKPRGRILALLLQSANFDVGKNANPNS